MKTKIPTVHRLEGGWNVVIPAGLPVVPAGNLPAESPIRHWLADLPPAMAADPEIESHHRNIGFGLLASEVE